MMQSAFFGVWRPVNGNSDTDDFFPSPAVRFGVSDTYRQTRWLRIDYRGLRTADGSGLWRVEGLSCLTGPAQDATEVFSICQRVVRINTTPITGSIWLPLTADRGRNWWQLYCWNELGDVLGEYRITQVNGWGR